MLQQAQKLSKTDSSKVLYVSLDDPYFYNHTIIDLAYYFTRFGGLYMFLDEAVPIMAVVNSVPATLAKDNKKACLR